MVDKTVLRAPSPVNRAASGLTRYGKAEPHSSPCTTPLIAGVILRYPSLLLIPG